MQLSAEHVCWNVNSHEILNKIDLTVEPGEFVGLIGPNGSGKSSLLRCIYRIIHPDAGLITLNGDDVWKLKPDEVARREAVVLQEAPSEFYFTVFEVVIMGRSPHKSIFDRVNEEDHSIVLESLDRVGMLKFADRGFHTLSGGEKQRTLLARALAQRAKLLVLDEPTNHLDICHQLEIMNMVQALRITTIAALHDLNLAALFCSHVYVLKEGKIVDSGNPNDILCPELIREVYGVDSDVRLVQRTGKVHITYFLGK